MQLVRVAPNPLACIAAQLSATYAVQPARFRDMTQPPYPIIPGLEIKLPDNASVKISVQRGEIRVTVGQRIDLREKQVWPVAELADAVAWLDAYLSHATAK